MLRCLREWQPRRLLGVFTELLDSGPNGADRMNDAVRDIVTADENDDDGDGEGEGGAASVGLAKLLKHARDWNTNSRSSRVAQVCSYCRATGISCAQIFVQVLARCHAVTVEDDDGFTRRVPNSFVVISERGQC
jgi:hypothetical protein